jgi:hypothetical protein
MEGLFQKYQSVAQVLQKNFIDKFLYDNMIMAKVF